MACSGCCCCSVSTEVLAGVFSSPSLLASGVSSVIEAEVSAPPWCCCCSGATFSSIAVPAAVPGSMMIEPGTAISSVEIAISGRGELGRLAAGE